MNGRCVPVGKLCQIGSAPVAGGIARANAPGKLRTPGASPSEPNVPVAAGVFASCLPSAAVATMPAAGLAGWRGCARDRTGLGFDTASASGRCSTGTTCGFASLAAAGSLAAADSGSDSGSGELTALATFGVASGVATASTSTALAPSQVSGLSCGAGTGADAVLRAETNNTNSTQACSPTEPNSEAS
jgi:hypothetical protein